MPHRWDEAKVSLEAVKRVVDAFLRIDNRHISVLCAHNCLEDLHEVSRRDNWQAIINQVWLLYGINCTPYSYGPGKAGNFIPMLWESIQQQYHDNVIPRNFRAVMGARTQLPQVMVEMDVDGEEDNDEIVGEVVDEILVDVVAQADHEEEIEADDDEIEAANDLIGVDVQYLAAINNNNNINDDNADNDDYLEEHEEEFRAANDINININNIHNNINGLPVIEAAFDEEIVEEHEIDLVVADVDYDEVEEEYLDEAMPRNDNINLINQPINVNIINLPHYAPGDDNQMFIARYGPLFDELQHNLLLDCHGNATNVAFVVARLQELSNALIRVVPVAHTEQELGVINAQFPPGKILIKISHNKKKSQQKNNIKTKVQKLDKRHLFSVISTN